MTTLYHTLFVDRMYSLEHNNMTAAPVIKGNTSGFLPTGASLSISKWRLREIGIYFCPYSVCTINLCLVIRHYVLKRILFIQKVFSSLHNITIEPLMAGGVFWRCFSYFSVP